MGDRKSSMIAGIVNRGEDGEAVGEAGSVKTGKEVRRDSTEIISDITGIDGRTISGPLPELVRRSKDDSCSKGSIVVGGEGEDGVRINVCSDEGMTLLLGVISVDVG